MLGIGYCKANPTDYILHFSGSKMAHEGPGLAFFYFEPAATIVSVPLASVHIPFVFTEPAADFQTITVQGQLTYRIRDPKKAAAMLDFTVDAKGRYRSDQYQKLPERLVYGLQTLVRAEIQKVPLRQALVLGEDLVTRVLSQLQASPETRRRGSKSSRTFAETHARNGQGPRSRGSRGLEPQGRRSRVHAPQRSNRTGTPLEGE